MNNAVVTLVGLSLALLATSCRKNGPVPAYVRFAEPRVVDASGTQVSAKVTDLWVFVNNDAVGVWQPGRPVPMLGQGPSRVKMIAGIRRNGVTDNRIQYPFYATWEQEVDLRAEAITEIAPTVSYFSGLEYWIADFNTGHRFDTLNCTATLTLVPTDSTLIGQGSHNGRIELDTAHALYRGVSSGDPFYIGTGQPAFLELDYRSDTRLLIGVRYKVSDIPQELPYVYLRPTGSAGSDLPWNKVYIDLSTPWAANGATDKRFYLQAQLEGNATHAVVEVDNIKLVTN